MTRLVLLGVLLVQLMAVRAQDGGRAADRHARISERYDAQDYAAVVREIDVQLREAPGTPYADSLHLYLYKYGRAHRKLKDAVAGVEAAERLYTLVKERGNAHHQVLALFDLSWTYYDAGELKQCARVDSIAVVVADSDRNVPFQLKGRARQYLAFDHSILGDHRRSAFWAQQALEQYARADSVPPVQWAESYTAMGAAYWHLGRIRDAEEQYNKALTVLGDRTDEASVNRKVSTYGNLGVLWQNAGDFARAKACYHESLRQSDHLITTTTDQFVRDEAIVNRSRTYLNLGTVYFQLGDEGRARELLDLAWQDRSSVLEPDDPQLLTVKDRIADLELARGSLEKAQVLVSDYLNACERKFGQRSEEYIRACSKLGEIAYRMGRHTTADSLLRLSIEAGRAAPDHRTDAVLALSYQRRARLGSTRGQHTEAVTDLERAREVMVSIYDSGHYKVAAIEVLLAEAEFLAGNAQRAHAHARSALHKVNDRVAALRRDRSPLAFPDPHILPDAVYWKVKAERSMAAPATVHPHWHDDLGLAMAALARNRAAVKDDASKLLLVSAQKRLYDLALAIAYDAFAGSGTEADAERFLQVSEVDRSTLLKSRINGFAGMSFTGVPDSVIMREQELIAGLGAHTADRHATTDLDRRERAYAAFLARLEKDYPAYFELRYGEPVITLAEVRQRLLKPGRQLLAYATTEDHIYILVVGLDLVLLRSVDATGLTEAVRRMNTAIATRDAHAYVEEASSLYTKIIAPVASVLNAAELLIIPDGPLHALSFDALLTGPTTVSGFKDKLLVHRHAIAYLLSATTSVRFAQLARDKAKGALVLAPGFDDETKRRYAEQVGDSARVDRDYLRFVRQPFAVRTAEELGPMLRARVLLAGAATERGFRDEAARHGILHLGTHAEMNTTSPMYSRLVLSKDGAGLEPDADGYLHAYEIYELDLRAQLAVLTACETGTGQDDAGEGVRSIGYGFAYAGCPSLVMSLWKIDEKVSSEIITRFYANLAKGMPKHLALRQAKLDHLDSAVDELALPYYWAGLVLVGDVEPVEMGSRWPWAMIVVLAVALIIAVLLFRRRRMA